MTDEEQADAIITQYFTDEELQQLTDQERAILRSAVTDALPDVPNDNAEKYLDLIRKILISRRSSRAQGG